MKANEESEKNKSGSTDESLAVSSDPKNNNQNKDNTDVPSLPFESFSIKLTVSSTNSSTSSETRNSLDSIEFIDIGPEEKINIKKVVKYKELNQIYIKGEVLGQGTFAKVRGCIHKWSLKRYAVKIMKKDHLRRLSSNVKKNIENEMLLVSKLNHKNVMKMIDTFSTDRKFYIVMEYCAGILTEILDVAPLYRLPKWQSHHYFCQVIDGLKYLHSIGVFHRDIKDDNLLIDNSNNIKIADFGVSYVLGQFADHDIICGYEGTKYYQPPELLDDEYSASKFDIWSSGVLLFKMVSGMYPFFTKNEDIFDKKSYDNLKYPKVIQKDKQLLDLLQKVLNIDFKDRITIKGIKDHPWVRLKHRTESDQKIEFPVKTFGDIYRGMNFLERLRVRYEYQTPLITEPEFVNQEEYEESIRPQNPNVRTDRSQTLRHRKEKLKPFRRLNRMGLFG